MKNNKHIKISTIEELREFSTVMGHTQRDPARIPKLLRLLKRYWMQPNCSDLRLGQIVGNFSARKDPYFLEDDALIKALEEAIKDEKST